jgi:hypothetical protein
VGIENYLHDRNNIDAIGVTLGMVANLAPAQVSPVDFNLTSICLSPCVHATA